MGQTLANAANTYKQKVRNKQRECIRVHTVQIGNALPTRVDTLVLCGTDIH